MGHYFAHDNTTFESDYKPKNILNMGTTFIITPHVINTINSIERLTNCQMTVTSEEENGMIKCCFPQKPDAGGRLLLDSMILGLQSIAEEYGKKYLKLKFKEV